MVGSRLAIGALVGAMVLACGTGSGTMDGSQCVAAGCFEADDDNSAGESAGADTDGSDGDAADDETDDGDGPDDSAEGDTGDGAAAIPCDVQALLAAECWMCHDDPATFGAPMPLRTLTDFAVPSVSDNTRAVHELVSERIADGPKPMPPAGAMPGEQASVLQDWIAAGMPPEHGGDCDTDDGDTDDGWGPEDLPCVPSHTMTAYDPSGSGQGFTVPTVTDLYQCFVLDEVFIPGEQGIAWAPVIDDERVVHHMLLLRSSDTSLQPGSVVPNCASLVGQTAMIMGWAPGSPNFIMPDEAGLELPAASERLILQVHYNNAAGHTDAVDASGFAMCTTPTPRDNAAATLWLGTTSINLPAGSPGQATGDCDTTRAGVPVTMLMSWPHMHEYGTTFTTEVIRSAGGGTETVVDVPAFNFDNQIYYEHAPPVVLAPGDVLRTTCGYNNTSGASVGFGEGTGDEMCFNFAMVYPIDAFDLAIPGFPAGTGRLCLGGGLPFP